MSRPSGFLERVLRHARERPEAAALVRARPGAAGRTTSWAELASEVERTARILAGHTPEGALLPLHLGRTEAAAIALLGALAAGRGFAVLHRQLRAPQLEAVVTGTGAPRVLVDGPGLLSLRAALAESASLRRARYWVVRDADFAPVHARALARLAETAVLEALPELPAPPATSPAPRPEGPSPAPCCLFTSGSQGAPKGVLMDEADLVRRARAEVRLFDLRSDDVLLGVLPFAFDVGLNQLLSSVWAGAALVLLDSWLPADLEDAAARHRATGLSAVPSLYRDWLRADLPEGGLRGLRYAALSGGDLAPAELSRLRARLAGVALYKTYGQTEAFRLTALRPEEIEARPRSVGRAFEGVRVYVVRPDGARCEPKEAGEVVMTGLGAMRGYLDGRDPERKRRPNPFRGPEDAAEIAVFTGDRGHLDAEGFLFLHGRADAMWKRRGQRVYPEEIAAQMLALPEVAAAEVVGVPRPENDPWVVAFWVPAARAAAESDALARRLAARLPPFMRPDACIALDALPRTESGKPDRPSLVKRALEALAAESGASGAEVPEWA